MKTLIIKFNTMKQLNLFYNTIYAEGEVLVEYTEAAKTQNEQVLEMFKKCGTFSPSQVFMLLDRKYPLTSIRRSFNTLTNEGMLLKTDTMIKGLYGRPEHMWRVNLEGYRI